jgi:hypothetical protein
LLSKTIKGQDERSIWQQDCPIRLQKNFKRNVREMRMARIDFGYLPHENPCAQCGKPIAAPEWVENGPHRTAYLWQCRACDYRFEAVAFFEEQDTEALAA